MLISDRIPNKAERKGAIRIDPISSLMCAHRITYCVSAGKVSGQKREARVPINLINLKELHMER